jgi:TPR repeat protein
MVGLTYGAILAVFAVFWFGGHDLVQHGILRLLLSWGGKMTLPCSRLFRYGAELIFLQRVGGGYRFIHQFLRDHFSLKQLGASFSVERPTTQRLSKRNVGLKLSPLCLFFAFSLIYGTVPELRYRIGAWMGDSKATFSLGQYYEQQDNDNAPGKAFHWYQQAAEQGLADAQFAIGILYHTGKGTLPDVNEAEKWYRRAADQGLGQAQLKLARMYSQGGDLPFDSAAALKWFQMAAESGLSEAQSALGDIYHTDATLRDYKKAEKWYRLAAAQGNINANGLLGWLLIKTGRWDEAQTFTQNAHGSDPQHWYWIINLANLELLRGKRPKAEDFYRQALPLIETERQLQLALNDIDLFIERDWQPKLCREMKGWLLTEWRQGQR